MSDPLPGNLPPAPPNHLPENPEFAPKSRYRKPRRDISLWAMVIGVVLGLAGGLAFAWGVAPLEEFNTLPRQLRAEDKQHYVVAVMLQFNHNGNLQQAIDRLIELNLGEDPIQQVADIACDLASSGYVDDNSGLRAVRAMMTFYQLQGRSGCADMLIPEVEHQQVDEVFVPTTTPTNTPVPSKTPTPEPPPATQLPTAIVVPTQPPQRNFTGQVLNTFCDTELSGVIEVFVQDFNGEPLPGQVVRVRWADGEDTFVTGLKPERGPAYADFEMTEGLGYTIDMPGQSDPIAAPLVADTCTIEGGDQAITSYRVIFRQTG